MSCLESCFSSPSGYKDGLEARAGPALGHAIELKSAEDPELIPAVCIGEENVGGDSGDP